MKIRRYKQEEDSTTPLESFRERQGLPLEKPEDVYINDVTGNAREEWLPDVALFFERYLEDWKVDGEFFEILVTTCDRLQRYHLCRLQIEKDGQTFESSTGIIKPHPLLAHEKTAYAGFLAGCRRLDIEPPSVKKSVGRPGRII